MDARIGALLEKEMKKFFIILILIISSLSIYSQNILKINSNKIKEENIYIVEDKLNILKSKKKSEIFIEKAFSYLLEFDDFYADILRKKENYSVQLFTSKEDNKSFVYLNFFILETKEDYFYTEEVVVYDGGSDFWTIKYDLEKEEFYDLWVNGEV